MTNTTHMAMGLLLALVTGCAAEPAAIEGEGQAERLDENMVTVVVFDAVTLAPLKDALVCKSGRDHVCTQTDDWGTARFPRVEEDVELTYMMLGYRAHRTYIAAEMWGSDRAGYFLPALTEADVDVALDAAEGVEDVTAGFILTPARPTIGTFVQPESDVPIVALGKWELFSNVPAGIAAIRFDHESQNCQGELSGSSAATKVEVTAGIVTVVPTLSCKPR